jgi:uncharacterized protein
MEQRWRSIGSGLGRNWKLVALAFVVVTVVLGLGARNLEFATGQDSYLDPDDQIAIDNELFQGEFGGEQIVLLFQAQDGYDITDLFEAEGNLAELERIEAELRAVPEVYAALTPYTAMQFSQAITDGGAGTNALLSALEREPDPAGVEARNADIGVTLARLPGEDERQIGNPVWDDFLLFANDNVEVVDGTPVMPEGDDRVVRASLESTFPSNQVALGGIVLEGNADLDSLSAGTQATLDIVETIDLEGFDVIATGSPVFLKDINDYLQGGMVTLGLIALAVMAVILFVMFPVRWRFLPLLSTVVGVLWGFTFLGYIDVDLSLVTISGLPILIGLGIDFAIQIHNRIEEEAALDKEAHPIAESVANIAPALIAATVAAVAAFTALQVSQVPMIRDFGIMLSVGIVALVFCGIVLPATILGVREYHSRTQDVSESWVERFVVKVGGLPQSWAVPLVIASIVLFIAGVAFEGRFRIESDPIRWVNQDTQTVRDLQTLEDVAGVSSTLGILVTANNVLADEVSEVVHDFIREAEGIEDVSASSSLYGTMAKIIAVPGATPLAPTSADLAAAAEVMPEDVAKLLLSEDRTATQVNLRLAPGSLEDRAELVTALEDDLNARIAAMDVDEASVLREGLRPGDTSMRAVPAGIAVVGVGLLENLSANRAILTYLGLTLSALFLLLRFRSLGRAALTLVPVGLAIGTSSVVIGVFGLTLSPMTAVSGPLVIASCTEFSVLITARYLEERQNGRSTKDASDHAARRTGRAFFTSAATTIGGFGVLIGSALPLLRDFGIIVTMNVAVALLAALAVMPPLLMWADQRGIFPVESHERSRAVVLGARPQGRRLALWIGGIVVLVATAVGLYVAADTDAGENVELAFSPQELPVATPDEAPAADEGGEQIPVSDYPTDRPAGLVEGTVFDSLTAQGADPQAANCTHDRLLAGTSESELLALAGSDQATLFELVADAARSCEVPEDVIAAAVEAGL